MPLAMMMICRTFIFQTSNSSSSGSRQAREEAREAVQALPLQAQAGQADLPQGLRIRGKAGPAQKKSFVIFNIYEFLYIY